MVSQLLKSSYCSDFDVFIIVGSPLLTKDPIKQLFEHTPDESASENGQLAMNFV